MVSRMMVGEGGWVPEAAQGRVMGGSRVVLPGGGSRRDGAGRFPRRPGCLGP